LLKEHISILSYLVGEVHIENGRIKLKKGFLNPHLSDVEIRPGVATGKKFPQLYAQKSYKISRNYCKEGMC